ncbi:hypothetical protein VMCG_02370 [Cytospora schulzeri]|uniref:Cyanovirin-N domain-containing protein n=1 Tax=Cytospora schulzeri TaxID=448051 RepID=A0A423X1T5_9PEZI|nr:hypothetical protein VMCG_02370 [Valsa malicola]
MKLLRPYLTAVLATAALVSSQDFSGFHHDCQEIGFTGDNTVVYGMGCAAVPGGTPGGNHESKLNINLCLSYVSSVLVAHQGGGYTDLPSQCHNCQQPAETYTCNCSHSGTWQLATIDLTSFIGVENGSLCCNAGSVETPSVRCGSYVSW